MTGLGATDSDILSLDPRIRNYVLIPISIIVIMQGILRHYVNILLQDQPRKPKKDEVKHGEFLRRSRLLRSNACVLTEDSFHSRRFSYINTLSSYIQELTPTQQETDPNAPPQIPMQSPDELQSMIGMMKQNMANVVPNMLSMAWISYFFSGFVLVKLPFPLTESFKSMLQQGVSILNLDPSYVSSLSWYFINLFGTRGILSLVLDQYNVNEMQSMYPQMAILPSSSGGTGASVSGPLKQEPQKPFEQEKIELEICKFRSVVEDAEYRILGKEVPRSHSD